MTFSYIFAGQHASVQKYLLRRSATLVDSQPHCYIQQISRTVAARGNQVFLWFSASVVRDVCERRIDCLAQTGANTAEARTELNTTENGLLRLFELCFVFT